MRIDLNTKRQKYGARRTKLDGYTFDSQAEARRYRELLLLDSGGYLSNIRVHPRYPLVVNGQHICDYVADFGYDTPRGFVLEDVKSPPTKTPLYQLKRKLFEALYHLPIVEVDTSTIRR